MATGGFKKTPIPNVIVFGETGVGKSSVLNMLDGGEVAKVNDGARGVTFDNTSYEKTIRGSVFRVFDTVGLNEAAGGTVEPQKAIEKLHELVQKLTDGVNLLVYVMRAPRIKGSAPQNYKMFVEAFCRKKVPVVIVVTGLEERSNMDDWWIDNTSTFDKFKMTFKDFACITATKGKESCYAEEYEASKKKLETLIYETYRRIPWKMSTESWFAAIAGRMIDLCSKQLGFEPKALVMALNRALPSHGALSEELTTPKIVPNIIVFGETGAGKSSVVNMFEGGDEALVSDKARGVTFGSTCYEKIIQDSTFRIFDTAGLNEVSAGIVSARETIQGLYQLIHQLTDGVNLLVYVMRAPRITATAKANYELFYEMFCDKKVPIVIVITGLEERDSIDEWWDENKGEFEKLGMSFNGSACITANQGKLRNGVPSYETEYETSKWKVEELIRTRCLRDSWKTPPTPWFTSVAIKLHNFFASMFLLQPRVTAEDLYRALLAHGGYPDEKAARAEARKIEKLYH